MFKTIVLALDGSDDSQRTIPMAAALARQDGARIVAAHVEQDVAGKGGGPIPATEDEIQAEIRKQAEQLSSDGINTTVEMPNTMLRPCGPDRGHRQGGERRPDRCRDAWSLSCGRGAARERDAAVASQSALPGARDIARRSLLSERRCAPGRGRPSHLPSSERPWRSGSERIAVPAV
jgi:Universal stress protein family